MVSLLQTLCLIVVLSAADVWGLQCYEDRSYWYVLTGSGSAKPNENHECVSEEDACYTLTGFDTKRNKKFMFAECAKRGTCVTWQNGFHLVFPVVKDVKCVYECYADNCNYESAVGTTTTTPTTITADNQKSAPAPAPAPAAGNFLSSTWIVLLVFLIFKF